MISLKQAAERWSYPLRETINYSYLHKRAQTVPEKLFVVVFWNDELKVNDYKSFDVDLRKINDELFVCEKEFNLALAKKIDFLRSDVNLGKSQIDITTRQTV